MYVCVQASVASTLSVYGLPAPAQAITAEPSPGSQSVACGSATATRPSAEVPRNTPNIAGSSQNQVSNPTEASAFGLCRTDAPGGRRFPYASRACTISGRATGPVRMSESLIGPHVPHGVQPCASQRCPGGAGSVGGASGTMLSLIAQAWVPTQYQVP